MLSACQREGKRLSAASAIFSTALGLVLLAPSSASAESTREQQWHLDAMQAEDIWKKTKGDGITVAVLDTGVDGSLPELKGQLLKGKNFETPENGAHQDPAGHGTSMAALIAGTGTQNGLQGLAPKAKILPVTLGHGAIGSDMMRKLPEAINYAVDSGAQIINLSFGTVVREDIPKGTQEAIDRAHKDGVLVFAGSGNEGDKQNHVMYPAALPGVIAVGATNQAAKPAKFSSTGQHLTLSAPGTDMPSRCEQNKGLCTDSGGTSSASALTSASAALIWSKNPTWTNNQVLRAMIETAGRKGAKKGDPPSTEIGYGTVRPRMVILEGEGDPGAPDKHPTFSKYYADLDAKSPSPDSSPDEDSSNNDKQPDQDDKPQPDATTANQDDKGNDTDTTLIIAGTATAALLVAGLVTTVLIRRRSPRTRQAP